MGQKVIGGMWCDYCQRPVAGQKPTSRARNTVVGLTVPLTTGLSLLGAKINKAYCPTCGQRVRPATREDLGLPPEPKRRSLQETWEQFREDDRASPQGVCYESGCKRKVPSGWRYCPKHRP